MLLPLAQEPRRRDAEPSRAPDEAGYEVLLARNGREALDSLARHRGEVDLVLSDLVMPVMGGRELADRLKAEYPWLPVVWMSGHAKDAAPVSSDAASTGLFLQKPIAPDMLVDAVARALERRGERRVRRPGPTSSPEA